MSDRYSPPQINFFKLLYYNAETMKTSASVLIMRLNSRGLVLKNSHLQHYYSLNLDFRREDKLLHVYKSCMIHVP